MNDHDHHHVASVAGVSRVLAAPQGHRDSPRGGHLQAGARGRVLQGQLAAVPLRFGAEGTQKCHRLEYSLLNEISHSLKNRLPVAFAICSTQSVFLGLIHIG